MLDTSGDRVSLGLPLLNVIQKLKKYDYLQIYVNSAIEQLKDLQ